MRLVNAQRCIPQDAVNPGGAIGVVSPLDNVLNDLDAQLETDVCHACLCILLIVPVLQGPVDLQKIVCVCVSE